MKEEDKCISFYHAAIVWKEMESLKEQPLKFRYSLNRSIERCAPNSEDNDEYAKSMKLLREAQFIIEGIARDIGKLEDYLVKHIRA